MGVCLKTTYPEVRGKHQQQAVDLEMRCKSFGGHWKASKCVGLVLEGVIEI